MSNALVIGGANGIGAGIVARLCDNTDIDYVYVADRSEPIVKSNKIRYIQRNFVNDGVEFIAELTDLRAVYITLGVGRVSKFSSLDEVEVKTGIRLNLETVILAVKALYEKINSECDIDVAIMCSIAGRIVSPLFSIYSATKAGLSKFIQSVNVELAKSGVRNRILEVSPGKIDGTAFYNGKTDLSGLESLATEIIKRASDKELLYIPQYEEIYKGVLSKNDSDEFAFGMESYDYKESRIVEKKKYKVGYLSGTFDMFHVGHLNLLKRAKKICDYLIVGVHKDASHKGKKTVISYTDRVEMLRACKYVDKVVESLKEDSDAWNLYDYDYLFVGSDYKGTERFNAYERYFEDKDVEIVYFPYTAEVSSTKLRELVGNGIELNIKSD